MGTEFWIIYKIYSFKYITIDGNETIKNNILYGFELDSTKVEESKQTEMDRIIIPSGMCKVFTGNPARYINFRWGP